MLEQRIGAVTDQRFVARQRQPLGGGCINQAWRVGDGERDFFVKTHGAATVVQTMFEAEAAGLAELAATEAVRVPLPIGHGTAAGLAFLVLEYLPLGGGGPRALDLLGHQLAALHRIPQAFFGWHRNNTIGSTPQPNDRGDDWITFWRERRLGFQLELAAHHGHGGELRRRGEQLLARFAGLFIGYRPVPALLHGDLWSGNAGCTVDGDPVIFDPACYYGDREADLAMTELFGGFPECFYAAYREALPLDVGYPQRRTLYNLYHVLNHLNLFGGGYRAQAEHMIDQLLAELG
ncbi:MAG: fructosamine kinase family protein [Candidatus Competibacteraceae bacterium]|nr:MAG: fructosamine kinase family protein [Candidatus Competibacteraceae bacterium]